MVIFEFSRLIGIILDPIILIVLALVIGIYLCFKNRKKDSIIFISMIFISGIFIKLLKDIVHRTRPINALIQESTFSMPSGHAAIAIVFFGFLAYLAVRKKSKKIKWLAAIIVAAIIVLISFTRLYLGVHYISDVVVGLILGLVVLIGGIIVSKRLS